jgi:hypothetical protein
MYLGRVQVVGRSFAAALKLTPAVVTAPAPAATKSRRGPPAALPEAEVQHAINNSVLCIRELKITNFYFASDQTPEAGNKSIATN